MNVENLKNEEVGYIKEFGIKVIKYVLNNNDFDLELEESFLYKIKMLEDNLDI